MQPYDYSIGGQSPIDAYASGLKLREMREVQDEKIAERKMRADALKAAIDNARLAQVERERFLTLENPTTQDVIRYSAYLPPEMVKALQPQFEGMSKERQAGTLRFGGEVVSALQGGRPELAVELLRNRSMAEKDPQQRDAWERSAKLVELNPKLGFKAIAPMLAALPGGKELLENIGKGAEMARAEELQPYAAEKAQGDAQKAREEGKAAADRLAAELEKSGWETKNLRNQIAVRNAKQGLDASLNEANILEKLSNVAKNENRMANIPADVRKAINESAIASGIASTQAGRLEKLATDIGAAGLTGGSAAKVNEWLRKQGGWENGVSSLRAEIERVRNLEAIKSLPPGPASNADLLFAREGMPASTADPAALARFLRGLAIMRKIESDVEQAKADFMGLNDGSLQRAKRSFETGGVMVEVGDTLAQVSEKLAKKYNNASPATPATPPSPATNGTGAAAGEFDTGQPSAPSEPKRIRVNF